MAYKGVIEDFQRIRENKMNPREIPEENMDAYMSAAQRLAAY